MPWTTHLGESRDEQEMFVHGRGPLHDFLAGLGRPMDDCGKGKSALATLTAAGCLGPECIAVHLNEWEEDGLRARRSRRSAGGSDDRALPAEPPVFPAPARSRWNACAGWRSTCASAPTARPATARSRCWTNCAPCPPPRLRFPPAELLETITRAPARALGLDGRLGCIRPGAFADLDRPALRDGDAGKIHAEILACRQPTEWQMVHGRTVGPSRA